MFQILQIFDDSITAKQCKLHMACWNGTEDPLDVYLAGEFDEWQAWQNRGNFNRDMVVSLIALSEPNRWLFAGVYDVHGWAPEESEGDSPSDAAGETPTSLGETPVPLVVQRTQGKYRRYAMTRRASTDSICGRLVIEFKRTSRQSYLVAERWETSLQVAELRAERLQVIDFPGYTKIMLSKQHLDIIVKQQNASWKSALSSVNGVYVIADKKTGRLYVGSATGEDGIWSRWCAYSLTGDGGNKELRQLLKSNKSTSDYADNFQFGVLETADSRATKEDILDRESHWKELLLTRTHGNNAN